MNLWGIPIIDWFQNHRQIFYEMGGVKPHKPFIDGHLMFQILMFTPETLGMIEPTDITPTPLHPPYHTGATIR